MPTSRIPGFTDLKLSEKLSRLSKGSGCSLDDLNAFQPGKGLKIDLAEKMVENAVGVYGLPLGIGMNFVINGREVLIPMVIEEPSVIAGASFMAKLARSTGGFTASALAPEMIGQIQVLEVKNIEKAIKLLQVNQENLMKLANSTDPVLVQMGGGARDIEFHLIEDSPIGPFLVLHLIYDVRDAMGANAVNTACERISPEVKRITGGRVHLKILSNLADRRLARSKCRITLDQLAFTSKGVDGETTFQGEQVRDGILEAWAFAASDPYRAATHNKGIMNGVDAVIIATGNDWRAIEAGAHSYAARNGKYTSLSSWSQGRDGSLVGELEMPMAVGIVGGATKVHPTARAALKLMGVKSAGELAGIIVSVGLAQNLAALRALATEGIQHGHMALHARQVAIAAGATGLQIEEIASRMVAEKTIRIDRAEELLKKNK